jgi:hypothetical protein
MVPCARCIGPPRSNSQYHSAKAITLVAQIDAPVPNNAAADPPAWPSTIARTSRTADTTFPRVINPISTMLAARTSGP